MKTVFKAIILAFLTLAGIFSLALGAMVLAAFSATIFIVVIVSLLFLVLCWFFNEMLGDW